jgi:transporter family-2 protein
MTFLWIVLAVLAGVCLATQVGVNGTLSRAVGSPVLAAAVSFAVGTVALGAYALITRIRVGAVAEAAGQPWWVWTGGVLGGFYVATMVAVAPRLGAATTIGLVIGGQMLASIALDHMGVLGFPAHAVNAPRVLGAALIVGGVVVVRSF